MQTWLLFGAGGQGVGACVLELAQQEARPVVALVRNTEAVQRLSARGVKVIQGDACDPAAVERVCQLAGSAAAIISTLGGTDDYLAHRTVIDSAVNHAISRMVMVTSLGCGDSWPTLSPRAKAAFGAAVREKSLAEVWLQTSPLDYAILRPGGLLNGESSGNARCYQQQEVHGMVNRQDVALTIQALLEQPRLNNQVYSLVDPTL
ncbi:anaerobilin reductase [Paramixta manurensis]|uniref:Anaerobilin reductase n=1 Tax=Paramixta manurensis TaxID=2740817 RepID=A0A6M8UI77_9GAMM|nr:anaerobilin reductase [Erwiniaceae bacterium PD-1]